MESSQASQPKQKKGLKKLWAKIKASMRSGNTKQSTTAPQPPTTPSKKIEEPAPVQTSQPTTTVTEPKPAEETIKVAETPSQSTAAAVPETSAFTVIEVDDGEEAETIVLPHRYVASALSSDKARFDRAQAVFEKYNMTLSLADWHAPSKSNILRVEKKPRMRVRWTCHECQSTFGRDKICISCNHARCTTCVRYPPKKPANATKKPAAPPEAIPPAATDLPATGSCHECKTEFAMGSPTCENCNHTVCERCLRETIMASPSTAPPPRQIATLTS